VRTGRWAVATAVVAVALVLELCVAAHLGLSGATPELVLVAVASLGLAGGSTTGAVAGFGGGLALDLVPPADGLAGRWALVLTVAGWLAGVARSEAGKSRAGGPVLVGVLAPLAVLAYAVTGALLGDQPPRWPMVLDLLPSAAAYAGLMALLGVPAITVVLGAVDPDRPR
jgi:rod shape-determining protein MreD